MVVASSPRDAHCALESSNTSSTSAAAGCGGAANASAGDADALHEYSYIIDMRSMRENADVFALLVGKLVFWMQAIVNKILPTALLCALSLCLVISMRNAERRRQMLHGTKQSTSVMRAAAGGGGGPNAALQLVLEVQEPTEREPTANGFGGAADGDGGCFLPSRQQLLLADASSIATRSDAHLIATPMLTPQSASLAQSKTDGSGWTAGEASYVERDTDNDADDGDSSINPAVKGVSLTAYPFRAVAPPVTRAAARSRRSTAAAGNALRRDSDCCQSLSGRAVDRRCRRTSRTTHLLLAICAIYICDYIPQVRAR